MTSPTGGFNLYRWLDVPHDAAAKYLSNLICEMDAALDRSNYPGGGGMREKLHLANAVLTNEDRRAIYDQHMGDPHTWNHVEYLANFDRWPDDWQVAADERLFRVMEATEEPDWDHCAQTHFKEPEPEPDAFPANPYAGVYQAPPPAPEPGPGPYPEAELAPEPRKTAPLFLRFVMQLLDTGIITALTAPLGEGSMRFAVAALFTYVYFAAAEAYLGGTLAKHLFGYQVRNAETGARLSIEESAKRNMWRLITSIPALGVVLGGPLYLIIGLSIAFSPDGRGLHDRLGDAEVVRKD